MLIDEYLLTNPIFDRVPLIFNALNRISSDSLFFFNFPLFELFQVASVDDLRGLKREALLKTTMNDLSKIGQKVCIVQILNSLITPVVLMICLYHILERKQHKKIKKSRKTGILCVKPCSWSKGLQVSNMLRPKLDSRRESENNCKNFENLEFNMPQAEGVQSKSLTLQKLVC